MSSESKAETIQYLVNNLTKYPDFPKPGIIFRLILIIKNFSSCCFYLIIWFLKKTNRDTFSLFRSPEAFRKLIDLFSDHIVSLGNIDAVVGLEARGFVIGSAISYKLGIPFVPIRKKGKLPGDVISYKYELEYGSVRV